VKALNGEIELNTLAVVRHDDVEEPAVQLKVEDPFDEKIIYLDAETAYELGHELIRNSWQVEKHKLGDRGEVYRMLRYIRSG
jgi:hypothetical protein